MVQGIPPDILLSMIVGAGFGLTALYVAIVRRNKPAWMDGVVLLLACTELTWAHVLQGVSSDIATKVFWFKMIYIGYTIAPASFFCLALRYGGLGHLLTLRTRLFLSVCPVLTNGLVFTNEFHGWVWDPEGTPVIANSTSYLPVAYAHPWHWVLIVYSYFLMGLGCWLLARSLIRSRGIYGWQASGIVIAAIVALLGIALDLFGQSPLLPFTATAVGLAGGTITMVFALSPLRRRDLLSVTRGAIISNISDGIVVIDEDDQIAEMNPAAEKLVGKSASQVIGQSLKQAWPELGSIWTKRADKSGEVVLCHENTLHTFDLRVSAIRDWRGHIASQVIVLRDITERKHVEEALARERNLLRTLIDNLRDYVYVKDADGRYQVNNLPHARLLGFDTPEQFRGKTVFEVFPAHLAEQYHADDSVVLRTGQALIDREEPGYSPDSNADIRNLTTKIPLRDDTGKIVGLVGVTRDITERKRAEKALQESEERYRMISTMASDYMFSTQVDAEGRLVLNWVAGAFDAMTGYTFEEYVAHGGWRAALHPDDRAVDDRDLEQLRANQPVITEVRTLKKSGETVWVQVYAHPVWDAERQKLVGIYGAVKDITERKKAEEALRESEEKLRQIASSLREVIWLRDVQTRQVLYVNPAFEELTGWTCESFYDNPDTVIDATHPDDKESVIKALDQRFEGVPFDQEHRIVHLDGSVRWVLSRSVPVRNEAGEVYRWASIMEDITARKRAEDQVRKLNEELEQRVVERTAQLQAANKELEAFAYSISHDLRAPLRAIDGYAHILTEDFEALLGEEGKRVCAVIRGNIRRMSQLIDDLLAFSRLSRAELQASSISMETLANAAFHESTTPESRKRIDFHLAPLPPAVGDPTLIRQVWLNLLSNAVKFSSKRERAVIEVGSQGKDGEIIYYVRDNGVGFEMQYVDKLFSVFQRLHSEKEYDGTGVGLAIVQRIIQRHGGRAWADAEVNRGATFYFTLPRKGK